MNVSGKTEPISLNSRVVATNEQVAATMDGEVVILGFQSGSYYGLDQVGAFVWDLLQQPQSVAEIRDAILAEYDVAPNECERDLLALLDDMATKQLIEVET